MVIGTKPIICISSPLRSKEFVVVDNALILGLLHIGRRQLWLTFNHV